MKRYPIYRSKIAKVSRSVGAIALPVAVLAVLAHRIGGLTTDHMLLAIVVATLIGLASLAMSLTAFAELWTRGGRGLADALTGCLYGLAALLPAGALAASQVIQGSALDITTDANDPPEIHQVSGSTPTLPFLPELASFGRTKDHSDIVSRRYRIPPAVLHVAALTAARRKGWRVLEETPPDLLDAPTGFQAEAKTLVLGLMDDVAVRIRPDPVGSLFDIRSASRYPLQDLGGNAKRVRDYYEEMDKVLLQTYGDIENLTVHDGGAEEPPQVEAVKAVLDEPLIPIPGFKPFYDSGGGAVPAEDAHGE